MPGIVLFEPDFQSLHDGFRIGLVGKLGVVPFEGFDETRPSHCFAGSKGVVTGLSPSFLANLRVSAAV